MKKINLLLLLLLTLNLFGQQDNLKEEFERQCDSPVPQYSYRDVSVLNNYQFYYNLTSPEIDIQKYLSKNGFFRDQGYNAEEGVERWIFNKDKSKQVFLVYIDCSEDTYAWINKAKEDYDKYFAHYNFYHQGNYTRNYRHYWLKNTGNFEVCDVLIPYGHEMYTKEKPQDKNERIHEKLLNKRHRINIVSD